MFVYADNAATTKISEAAAEAERRCEKEFFANPSSLHSAGQRAAEELERARTETARAFSCPPRGIIFTSGGSESDNQAIISAARAGAEKGKKHIISSSIEHHAVLHTLEKLRKNEGFEITLLGVGENGIIKLSDLEAAIREDTCLVSIMYANNEIGSIQPIAQTGAICRSHGVVFHTDAVQAAGHLPINTEAENIDMMSVSAHKFHGPRGTGILYVRPGTPVFPLIEGGAQEKGRRAGTENLPGIAGMAAALSQACADMEKNSKKLCAMRDKLIKGLSGIPYSVLNGDREKRLPGNVNFCFEGIEGESLLLLLDSKGICASSGSACASGSLEPSHVLLALGRPHEIAHGSLRLSLSEENTEEQTDYMLREIPQAVAYLRSISPVWKDLENGRNEFTI